MPKQTADKDIFFTNPHKKSVPQASEASYNFYCSHIYAQIVNVLFV